MSEKIFVFIDESGSPDFLGKRKRPLWLDNNFQPVLLLGMLVTKHRKKLRMMGEDFQNRILEDSLYNSIYSVSQPNWFLHAKDDHPEVRIQFFEQIRKLDFMNCYVIIARKIPELFINKHNSNPKEFYFDVLYNLIQQFQFEENFEYQFYLARRDKQNAKPFTESIEKVVSKLTKRKNDGIHPFCSYQCDMVKANTYPEMSVIDYLLWSVQRYIMKNERRYLTAMEKHFKLINDVYDKEAKNNFYKEDNLFFKERASDFFDTKK